MTQDTLFSSLSLGAVFGAYIGAVPSLVIGWPLHVVLLRKGWTYPLAYCALGLVLAFVAFALIGPLFGFGSIYAYQIGAPVLVLAGVVGGLVVWAIRRPDHDARTAAKTPG